MDAVVPATLSHADIVSLGQAVLDGVDLRDVELHGQTVCAFVLTTLHPAECGSGLGLSRHRRVDVHVYLKLRKESFRCAEFAGRTNESEGPRSSYDSIVHLFALLRMISV